jgi:tRNA pseudouridine55 synthase
MMPNQEPENGQVLLIDKELNWTSFDVVKKLRNVLRIRKIGHAGTLDPLATGLLILCTGRMTKQINRFMDMEKEYTGTMVIGKTTPSVDLETGFDSETSIEGINEHEILKTAEKFRGELVQVPPIYSAIKMKGDRLYNKARKGETVEIQSRKVTAYEFEITGIELPAISFRLVCSKGFYVRSLVRDFGQTLGTGAYLSELRRTRIGSFHVKDAQTIESLQKTINPPS